MASPADTILRILAMRQQQGAQNQAINQNALSRFFAPLNAGIARGQGMAQQSRMQEQSQAFQGEQADEQRAFTAAENVHNRRQQKSLQDALMQHRSGEAEKSRGFRSEEMGLDRELTREGIEQQFRLSMAGIGARQREGAADRAFRLQTQKQAFDQRDREFKKQTRVAFARDVRAAMEDQKSDDRAKAANVKAIQTRYAEEMKLQERMAAIEIAAGALRSGKKGPEALGLATPTAYLNAGPAILKGNAMGDRFEWLTPEMERDIHLVLRATFKLKARSIKENDPELYDVLEKSLDVLAPEEE